MQLGSRLIRSSSRSNNWRAAAAVPGAACFCCISAALALEYPSGISVALSNSLNFAAGGSGCARCFTALANATLHPQTNWLRTLTPLGPSQLVSLRGFADLPAHSELTMPSLSPTMNQVQHKLSTYALLPVGQLMLLSLLVCSVCWAVLFVEIRACS